MKINFIAIGNRDEGFFLDSFTDGLNIISSDDNNKGKTIVIQSCFYAMGNEPAFPSSFDYKDYYHVVSFDFEEKNVICCRKRDSFTVKFEEKIYLFDSVSELKRFMQRINFPIPTIIKDGIKKIVDPCLLYELFFIGQDKKNTSNLVNSGYYNKDDFYNMVFSLCGINGGVSDDHFDEEETKKKIRELEEEKLNLKKTNKILSKKSIKNKYLSSYNDHLKLEETIKQINNLKDSIVELSNKRNRALNRRVKNEQTLNEIKSLNLPIKTGGLVCGDCNSTNIIYKTGDNSYSFEVSSKELRNNILTSIKEKIDIYTEEIEELTSEINKRQKMLQDVLKEEDVSLEDLLFLNEKMNQSFSADERLLEIEKELTLLKEKSILIKNNTEENKAKKIEVLNFIRTEMNNFYKELDPDGTDVFDIFSKQNSLYSGVEATEYYLSKLYALKKITNHSFPIVMDYFRDGELSSQKEEIIIKKYSSLPNQVIFTATLKNEEGNKYNNYNGVNNISFNEIIPYKLLSQEYVATIARILSQLNIYFE